MSKAFEKRMLRSALALLQKAGKDGIPLEESTKAFKEVTTFYAILQKRPSKNDDEAGNTTFDELRNVVQQESAPNGSGTPPVRDRT